MVVIVKVIHWLIVLQAHVINIANACCPLEIEMRRPNIIIFIPASIQKSFSQVSIPTFDDEDLLIKADSISPLPCLHVDVLFSFFHFFFLLFNIIIVLDSRLSFCWRISTTIVIGLPWFVFQTPQLLIGIVIKFLPSFISPFWFQLLFKLFLNLIWFHRIAHEIFFASERIGKIIFAA